MTADLVSNLVVHVCATDHLTNWVFGDCLGGPDNRARPKRENNSFSGLQDISLREVEMTDRRRLVCSQKTSIFRPR